MKKLKRLLAIGFALILSLSFSACGNAVTSNDDSAPSENEAADTASIENEATDTADSTKDETAETTEKDEFTVGFTVMDLSNPIWAEICESAVAVGKEQYNATITVLEAKNEPATQISQVENFINMGVDAIIIAAVDVTSMDAVCKKAMDAGILVMGYGMKLNECDLFMINDNAGAGKLIGELAAEFINDNYGGKADVGLITYYEAQETLDRGDAMKESLAANCPEAKVVMEASSVVADEGMEITENFLQAYPDMKVIMSIGDGAAVGANQAIKAANKQDGFGIFAVDCTIEAMQIMANGENIIGEVSFGTGSQIGVNVIDTCMKAVTTGVYEKENYTPNILVTPDNLSEKIKEWGYEDQIDMSKLGQ